EILASIFGERRDGKPGCVCGDQGSWSSHGVDFFKELRLYCRIFDDRFNDPIGVAYPAEIVSKATDLDLTNLFRDKQRRRRTSLDPLQCGLYLIFREVQQQHGQSRVCGMRGDLGSHGARSEYCDPANHGWPSATVKV